MSVEEKNLYDKTAHCIMIQSLFTAEMSDSRILFLNIKKSVKARGLTGNPSLMPYKEMDTFDHFNFYSYHSPGTKKRFVKGEALCLQ